MLWRIDNATLNSFPLIVRGLLGGLMNGLPVAFSGVIVSMLLARSAYPTASLGSNLLGSVIGGCLEYLSMLVGLRALALLALILYSMALFVLFWSQRLTLRGSIARPHHPQESEKPQAIVVDLREQMGGKAREDG